MLSVKKETKLVVNKTNKKIPLQAADAVSEFCTPVKHGIISRFHSLRKSILFSGKVSSCSSQKNSGSMTVEAAVVLPFFLMVFLSLISFLRIIQVQNGITMGLREAGMPMSVYAYAQKRMQEDSSLELTGVVGNFTLSYGYAGQKVREFLRENIGGIQYYKSSILEKDDVIDLVALYSLEPDFNVALLPSVRLSSRFYGRAWTGYAVDGSEAGVVQEENVYITQDGTVYHRNRYCTHLQLTVLSCPAEQIEEKRNENGASYHACAKCGGGKKTKKVYITPQGDCYHTSIQCSGLKRTIEVIPISKVGNRTCCSRCGG